MPLFRLARPSTTDNDALTRLFEHLDLSSQPQGNSAVLRRLGTFTQQLENRIAKSLRASVGIAAHAPELARIARDSEQQGEQLAQSSELIASAIEEISQTLESELMPGATQVAGLSDDVSQRLQLCQNDSRMVLDQVQVIEGTEQQLAGEIQRLGSQIEEMTQVIGMIATISQQTNLLALNAAIEAARAGEQGRGFAVVADEVRRLAGSTTAATDQVSQIIDGFREGMQRLEGAGSSMHQAIAEGREGIQRVDHSLAEAGDNMNQLDKRVASMASGTEQIGAAVRSLSQDVQGVADIAGSLTQRATQISEHSEAVRAEGDHLLDGLGGFQLDIHQQISSQVSRLAADQRLLQGVASAESCLRQAVDQDGRFELMYLVGADGIQVSENVLARDLASGNAASVRGRNWSDRSWFREVRNSQAIHISPVYRSSATDAFCFTLSAPVFADNGELRYVLGTDVRLSALLSQPTAKDRDTTNHTATGTLRPAIA
ncbi:Methyl-accepting chemotaxis protein [Halopseudomonas salegens]|uniref:Methyl-accepting chemotaxis protein n=1 Tax=Halopseudomonas salegens TaxID=1434072 RepID=A0A1H2ERV2_9GAMM|nr:methyl-accepting chemotaxis protein [Halopseudomonas salegens]SDT97673.1 Methyl-accepting chemotaxis protein [Halopseudomonas salegens]